MPNVQWMSYSFVRLYSFKCDVCVLIYIWIKPKRFLIILYVFGSDFYHLLCSCLVLTLFFIILNMFCVEKQVLEFLTTHLATHQLRNASRKFIQKLWRLTHGLLATRENFRNWTSWLVQSQNAQKSLFKWLFLGNLF